MMWHWNSLWAPAAGDPPAIDDPALWRAPWSAEQALALQARSWEAMLSAAHSWWSMALAAWPVAPALSAAWPTPRLDVAATAGAEPLALKPPADAQPATAKPRAARKRSSPARKR
jgi:hypothetical protein